MELLSAFAPGKIFDVAKDWKGSGEIGPRIAAPLSLVRDLALLSCGEKEAIMNEDLVITSYSIHYTKLYDG